MTRDWELIRSLLVEIEQGTPSNGQYIFSEDQNAEDGFWAVRRAHLRLMREAGFIRTMGEMDHYVMGITWSGYEFLDQIRDDEIWDKTKNTAVDIRNFSVETLKDIAKAYAKKKLRDLTDLETI